MMGRQDIEHPWLFARCKEVQAAPNGFLDLWAREHYKLLCNKTPVITPSGMVCHGDLKPGDMVYSPDGCPVRVLAVTGELNDPEMYYVRFGNLQQSTEVELHTGADHLWNVEYFDRRRVSGTNQRIGWVEARLSTRELINRTQKQQQVKSPRWYRIPYAKPLLNTQKTLPVQPYTLGAWLGDGTSGGGQITNGDDQLWGRIESEGYNISHDQDNRDCTQRRTVYGLIGLLHNANLAGCKSDSKYIPIVYQEASLEQRIALIQGLMDTDGSIADRGNYIYTTISARLADDVKQLLSSLGVLATVAEYSFNRHDGEYTYYKVSFVPCPDVEFFSLDYHKCRIKHAPKQQYWYIRDIEKAPTVPSQCVQVEGGKYLAGKELIPTNNSTIITYALTIQDILKNPNITVGIFSHTRPIAKAFLRQIKREFEDNQRLKELFPDIVHDNPRRDAQMWSEDSGLVVRRSQNPKEGTVEAHGLVDGQPVSKHFDLMVYDDVVTLASVNTPDMIAKTTEAWEMSLNLGSRNGARRHIGTRYHFNDTYAEILRRGAVKERIYQATEDGKVDGIPVLLTKEALTQKRRDMGPYTFSSQMMQNPTADETQGFLYEWLNFYQECTGEGLNKYILVDPANEKRKHNDYSSFWVIGLGPDKNIRVLAMVRDRLNLPQRANMLFQLHRTWGPLGVAYEQYGMQADIQYVKEKMEKEHYNFEIIPVGGQLNKNDRIRRLIPYFEQGRIFLPGLYHYTNYEGITRNLVQDFIEEEYKPFPVGVHDDMLDALARLTEEDLNIIWPMPTEVKDRYSAKKQRRGSWMTR